MNGPQQSNQLAMQIAQFEEEPTPTHWTGKPFKDKSGGRKGTFILEGTVGAQLDQFVLTSEGSYRGGGAGTRIIRRYDMVEPTGNESESVRGEIYEYMDAVESMTEGTVALRSGKLDEASEMIDYALSVFQKHGDSAELSTLLTNAGNLSQARGNGAEANDHFREAVAVSKRVNGEVHGMTAKRMVQLADSLKDAGQTGKAESKYDETISISERVIREGREGVDAAGQVIIVARTQLGRIYYNSNRRKQSQQLFQLALQWSMRAFGPQHQISQNIGREMMQKFET